MRLNRSEVCGLIPHHGKMCLLDGVEHWDEDRILCLARSHLCPDNPLRSGGELHGVHALEYGAQAIAVHGALLGGMLREARIVALRDAYLEARPLDAHDGSLAVHAQRVHADPTGLIYQVRVEVAGKLIARARITVMATGGDA